ncbi:hypothetical protein DBT_1615 [Dissulfuribacter thermophilus]|uniref:VCBS repeat-containing protein n=1 Tax=Dissulfuribacter thermophilus TaxID=1156395 RepID=A0A1B9F5A8_9BACT|nr:hypothetical protein [Dissulfuribacter thermophilus]OCC15129.1 hypothetical protein DBT_1615 [Dissulfuribacter thermophilus]
MLSRIFLIIFCTILPVQVFGQQIVQQQQEQLISIFEDLRPILAHIVSAKDKIVIDVGKIQGVKKGDLFSVYIKNGELISHGKKLGFKKNFVGVLEVISTDQNRSTCRLISSRGPIKRGAEVERFTGLRATIVPKIPFAYPQVAILSKELKEQLWSLKWINSDSLPDDPDDIHDIGRFGLDLLFLVSKDGISVFSAPKRLLRFYAMDLSNMSRDNGAKLSVSQRLRKIDFKLIGALETDAKQVVVTDCDKNGLIEVYALIGDSLYVQEYGSSQLSYSIQVGEPYTELHSLSLWCKGAILAINVLEESVALHSKILKLSPDGIKNLVDDVNLWFRFAPHETGEAMDLIGQEFVNDQPLQYGRLYVLGVGPNGLIYQRNILCPKEFRLNKGFFFKKYYLFEDSKGNWIIQTLTGKVKSIDPYGREQGFRPVFNLSVPYNNSPDHDSIIIPLYSAENDMTQLYILSLGDGEVRPFSDPVEGKIIGLDALKQKIYLSVTRKDKGTFLFVGQRQKTVPNKYH